MSPNTKDIFQIGPHFTCFLRIIQYCWLLPPENTLPCILLCGCPPSLWSYLLCLFCRLTSQALGFGPFPLLPHSLPNMVAAAVTTNMPITPKLRALALSSPLRSRNTYQTASKVPHIHDVQSWPYMDQSICFFPVFSILVNDITIHLFHKSATSKTS